MATFINLKLAPLDETWCIEFKKNLKEKWLEWELDGVSELFREDSGVTCLEIVNLSSKNIERTDQNNNIKL